MLPRSLDRRSTLSLAALAMAVIVSLGSASPVAGWQAEPHPATPHAEASRPVETPRRPALVSLAIAASIVMFMAVGLAGGFAAGSSWLAMLLNQWYGPAASNDPDLSGWNERRSALRYVAGTLGAGAGGAIVLAAFGAAFGDDVARLALIGFGVTAGLCIVGPAVLNIVAQG